MYNLNFTTKIAHDIYVSSYVVPRAFAVVPLLYVILNVVPVLEILKAFEYEFDT